MITKESKSSLLEGLNQGQLEAVTYRAGPLLIVAGAGTGKTAVITRKIAWLIEKKIAQPEQILALTFTDKAAAEMEERVDKLLPYGYVSVTVSTFHSFCESILRDYGLDVGLPADFKLLNQTDQWLLVRQNLSKFELDYYRPLGNPTRFVHALISHFSRLKDENISPAEYLEYAEGRQLNLDSPEFTGSKEEEEQEVKRVMEAALAFHVYQQLLYEKGMLDFGDLIVESLRLFKKRPNVLKRFQEKFKYILVDEFQDTNYAQYELVKMIAAPDNNLTVVADDDQSIYKFRGASFSNIIKFQEHYPDAHHIFLVENYRSKQDILDLAYKFIQQNNPNRLEIELSKRKSSRPGQNIMQKSILSKKLVASEKGKGIIEQLNFADQYREASGVVGKILQLMHENSDLTYNDFAILARGHDSLVPFIDELSDRQVPYIYFANKGLYRQSLVIDFLAYFKLLDNYHDSQSLYRVLNFPVFNINHAAVVELAHYARKKSISLFEALKQASSLENIDQPSLLGISKLLQTIDKHTRLASEKSVFQVFVQVFRDLEFHEAIGEDPLKQLQSIRSIDALSNKIKNFVSLGEDKSLKSFMSQVAFELESGEQGSMEQDLEAGPEAVKVMTVHAAKGLEYKYIFVVGLVDKRFPSIERKEAIPIPDPLVRDIVPEGDVHLQEERRLFYVALTRAKQGVYLTRAKDYGGKLTKKPSRFLVELKMAEEEKSVPTGEVVFEVKKTKLHLPVPRNFSFSQISSFRKCPLEYKYRHILALPTSETGNMSFGKTIHATFEKFLLLYRQSAESQDLFGSKGSGGQLPKFDILSKIYKDSWIGDWFDSKSQMEEYRARGLDIIKAFYEQCGTSNFRPKYLEEPFELRIGGYKFTGKIDRADASEKGLVIIDYKTGEARKIDKVDTEQLLIYQLAAKEYLKENVVDLQYWFLAKGLDIKSFLGTEDEVERIKHSLEETITEIVKCIKDNNFYQADLRISHDCQYRNLETGVNKVKV